MNVLKGLPISVCIDSASIISLDLEMFGQNVSRLHRPHGEFACISVCINEDVWIVTEEKQLPDLFKLIAPAKYHLYFNSMYDIRQLRRFIPILQRPIWDCMVVEKVLWGGYFSIHEFALNDCVRRYLNIKMDKDTRKQFSVGYHMSDEMIHYAATDAYLTYKVYLEQLKEIERRKYDMCTYWELEEPCLWCTLDFKPVKVNVNRWREMVKELTTRGRSLENDLGVNVNSWQQLKEFIKNNTGVKVDNVQEDTLLLNANKIGKELVDKILLTKSLRKAESTYGENWLRNFVEDGDLVYSDWHSIGTETGRYSSESPNLQNIPARKIPEYRTLFISAKGRLIVADVQAQEPRILAHLSGDKALKQIFADGQDVHTIVTRAIFKDDTITKADPRRDREGKTINLASSYGLSAQGLADKLNIELVDAETFLRNYFAKFSGVAAFRDRMYSQANRFEYVESISGRRIWINRHNFQWQNNSINSPIQSSAADLLKGWLIEFHKQCTLTNVEFADIMCVHDELVLDVPLEQVTMYETMLKDTFQTAAHKWFGDMPFEIDLAKGTKWSCKKLSEEEVD